jgi:hypothetical protein
MNLKNLWREPLLHFLIVGVALFYIFDLRQGEQSEAPNRIVVDGTQIQQLTEKFKRTWLRTPTQVELDGLIENHIREEVFYREALAMGLDQGDPLVKNRLKTKLEYMLEELSAVEASEEELTAFLNKHADRFRVQTRLSFQQVYLNPEKRPDVKQDAGIVLAKLQGGISPQSIGDATMLPAEYTLASTDEIARSFGAEFAQEVVKQQPGDWAGPFSSAYGLHLIKVREQREARLPPLAEIRNIVEREYMVEQKKIQKDKAYQKLLEGYEIIVEPLTTLIDGAANALASNAVKNLR